jgi:hypothetical protein
MREEMKRKWKRIACCIEYYGTNPRPISTSATEINLPEWKVFHRTLD